MPDVDLPARALGYASHGLEVFPVHPRTKAPLVSQKLATTHPAQIRRWWTEYGTALIGHRLAPEHIILDIDPRHGGDLVWSALLAGFGDDIEAQRRHHSGRNDGGFHAWYKLDGRDGTPTIHGLRTWAESHGYPELGIDLLRHDHRYTILPPSPHPATGEPYAWDIGDEPGPLPEALAELLYALDPVEHERVEPTEGALTTASIEHPTSPADWYSSTATWPSILEPHGWKRARGDGDRDGSMWKHPNADPTHEHSASIKHGCLFVYSDGTPFETTEGGMPRGYTRFAAYALLVHGGDMRVAASVVNAMRERVELIDVYQPTSSVGASTDDDEVEWIDWSVEHDSSDDIVEGLIVPGRWTQFVAPAKAGKSTLMIYMAVQLSLGVDPIYGSPITPVTVAYFDGEMGRADLDELIRACGHDPAQLTNLRCTTERPPLNKPSGAARVLRAIEALGARLVVLDGLNGFVSSDVTENSDEGWRAIMDHLVSPLKRLGCALMSGDNMGKDKEKGARGSSVKADKADAVIAVTRTDTGVRLHPTHTRGGAFIVRDLDLDATGMDRSTSITYRRTGGAAYPAGTANVAALLDKLGIPLDDGRDKVRSRLADEAKRAEAAGLDPEPYKVSTDKLRGAVRYRKEQADLILPRPDLSSEVRSIEADLFDERSD